MRSVVHSPLASIDTATKFTQGKSRGCSSPARETRGAIVQAPNAECDHASVREAWRAHQRCYAHAAGLRKV